MKKIFVFLLMLSTFIVSLYAESENTPLLFTIGVHVEPFGKTYQGYGSDSEKSYTNDVFFKRHYDDILMLAALVEKYGGKLTVQVQSPFTEVLVEKKLKLLSDLESRGHEIALHFHENMHLGNNCNFLPPERWAQAMKEEIELIKKAGASEEIVFWSGGNLYPELFQAAAMAGLSVNADWKNPNTQTTDENLTGIWPWRPQYGYENGSTVRMAANDPDGPVIYLPQGIIDGESFGRKREIVQNSGLGGWLKVIEEDLLKSLEAVDDSRVNVFHFTLHPTEFVGDPKNPYHELEEFLKNVITPLVNDGKVKWATFREKAEAYEKYEGRPGKDETAENMKTENVNKDGFITFVINVHDICNTDESADTVNRFIDLFDKYGVKGDFYLTAPIVQNYLDERPDVIERLKASDMTISYHYRAPHIAYMGFDEALESMTTENRRKFLRDYELYAIDLKTGRLDKSKAGGFSLLKEVFGESPIVASALNFKWRSIQLPIYRNMGAQMTLSYHEGEADPDNPFEYEYGLLVRPSDFGVTQWTDDRFPGTESQFWWNHVDDRYSDVFDPVEKLNKELHSWNGNRKPFITALIHENNMYAKGSTWQNIFYDSEGNAKKPPYDLNSDTTVMRSTENSEAIWQKYEALLAFAAENLEVVTSADIVKIAE